MPTIELTQSTTQYDSKDRALAKKEALRNDEKVGFYAAETLDTSVIQSKEQLMQFIRFRRKLLGKTQAQIAHGMGSQSAEYVGLIEAGKRLPDLERWPGLAAALEVNRQELVKLYMRIMMPNTYMTFWADEAINLNKADSDDVKFTKLPPAAVELLQKIYGLPGPKRRHVEETVAMLSRR